MEVVLGQVRQSLETVIANVENHFQQLLDEQRTRYENEIVVMQQELGELRAYKDVSLVNKLTVQVDQLQTENLQLKKRLRGAPSSLNLGTQSTYTATTAAPTLTSLELSKPAKITPKVKQTQSLPEPPLAEPVKAQVAEPVKAQVAEPVKAQVAEPVKAQVAEPVKAQVAEPVKAQVAEPVKAQAAEPEHEIQTLDTVQPNADNVQETEEPQLDLFLIDNLISGQYFWEPESGNLYERLSDEEAGNVIGKIKTIKVRDRYYYQDTIDNHVYQYVEDTGDIGEKCGRIVNGKFVKN
jgi:hypothetical protein